jgi:diacylglycerol O-acyltransferase / wax synthase
MPAEASTDYRFGDRMTDLEAMMWGLESHDPAYRSTMRLVVSFDGEPDRIRVLDRLELVSGRIPRLRDRVVAGPLTMVPPRWEPDPDFDVANHLQEVRAPGAGTVSDLFVAAGALAAYQFDPARPPWRLSFVVDEGGATLGLILELHHSYTDGLGGVKLALELFDLEQSPSGSPPAPPRPRAAVPASDTTRLAQDLEFGARHSADLVGRVVPWAAQVLRQAVRDPGPPAATTFEVLRTLQEQAGPRPGRRGQLMSRRSAGVRLAAIDLPLDGLRRAARHANGTVNDAFLAGVLGGLGAYHRKHGSNQSTVRLAMPVSTRSEESGADMRNQVLGVLVRGPLTLADPIERIRLLHELAGHARGRPVYGLLDEATGIGLGVPGIRRLVARALRAVDVVASNVPGPPVDLYLAGARLERMVPFGPREGAGLNVTLLSFRASGHVGVNMDPAATPDTGTLLDCLAAGFEEVLA